MHLNKTRMINFFPSFQCVHHFKFETFIFINDKWFHRAAFHFSNWHTQRFAAEPLIWVFVWISSRRMAFLICRSLKELPKNIAKTIAGKFTDLFRRAIPQYISLSNFQLISLLRNNLIPERAVGGIVSGGIREPTKPALINERYQIISNKSAKNAQFIRYARIFSEKLYRAEWSTKGRPEAINFGCTVNVALSIVYIFGLPFTRCTCTWLAGDGVRKDNLLIKRYSLHSKFMCKRKNIRKLNGFYSVNCVDIEPHLCTPRKQ